eukprot:7555637-Alexandrium_andersonii.AAC.1
MCIRDRRRLCAGRGHAWHRRGRGRQGRPPPAGAPGRRAGPPDRIHDRVGLRGIGVHDGGVGRQQPGI